MRFLKAIAILSVGISLTLGCSSLFSQTPTGRILGTVRDSSQSIVPTAIVAVTDVQRGVSRNLTTDEAGEYAAPDLDPGVYKVTVGAPGFRTVEHSNIQVEVGKDARVDFVLEPGETSETVTVTEETPQVETTNDVLGGTLTNQTINDLPLNGRSYENLLQLRPGVTRYPGGGADTTSTNGLRPSDNNYIVDGFDNNEAFWSMSVIGGDSVTGNTLPIDAIQEFNVEQNPPAEYGWKPGAVVNIGLKSGTNGLHGTAYAFGRSDTFDARNHFNTVDQPKTPLDLEQFGATAGGPIVKNKLFFFAGYEGLRYLVGNSFTTTSPATVSLAASNPASTTCSFIKTGDCRNSIPDAIADLKASGIPVSPLSQTLSALFPTNLGTNPLGPSVIPTGFPNTNSGDNGIVKIDAHVGERNTFTGMYFIGQFAFVNEDVPYLNANWLSVNSGRAQVWGGTWTYLPNSRWVNEARFSFIHDGTFIKTADSSVSPLHYGINTGVTNPLDFGMPDITVNGFNQLGGGRGWPVADFPDDTYQFVDHVSYLRGKHAFKFGFEVRRASSVAVKDQYARGFIRFAAGNAFPTSTPLEDFFAGTPANGEILTGQNSSRNVHMWEYAGFAQDDWRLTPRLTLNLGLRYEINTVLKEAHNLLGNFDPNQGIVQVGQQIQSPFNQDRNNFAPRLGVAWDVKGNGKTVIRAGGGVMYDLIAFNSFLSFIGFNNAATSSIGNDPTAALGVTPGGGTITTAALNVSGSALNWTPAGPVFPAGQINCSVTPCSILAVNRNLRTPYVVNWDLDVEHQFTPNLALDVSYVGNHGTNILSNKDINQVQNQSPAEIACGHCEAAANRPYGAKFPFLGFINYLTNDDKSNYNGLQATLTLRNSHGFSFIAGYTYSHALDDLSDNRGQNPMDSTQPGLEYGSSDWDVRHRFTFSSTYALPGRKSFAQLLQGWQLNSILTLQTAQPWNIMDTGDDISRTGENSDRWDFFGKPSDFSNSHAPIPYFPGSAVPAACIAKTTTPAMLTSLQTYGCFMKGASVMIPPAIGTFGTMGRNIFRGPGFHDWDVSIIKSTKFGERLNAQFRAEFFNVLNHPLYANPMGENYAYGLIDPSVPATFGCSCATPDTAAGNPVVGSGSNRAIQLGLKLIF